ncbi:MAG: AI-2E family transporter [Ruminococcaceae bacterium]|nr:AI-2E family transporter [Oscillospiraceae bacterium]
MKTDNIKKPIIIVSYAIVLYFIVNNLTTFSGYVSSFFKVIAPLIIGGILAFIINLFLRFYEKKVFVNIKEKWKKLRRPVCVILSYLTFFLILFIIVKFISPRLEESIKTLTSSIPAYVNSVSEFFYGLTLEHKITEELWNKVIENFDLIITNTTQFLNTALPKIFSVTKTVTSSVFDVFIGFVFSVYMLLSKEKLVRILKKILRAHTKENFSTGVIDVFRRANKIFRSFVGGQLSEAVILGILCYIGMSIFKMPYAPLISVIIGISSIVPVIGAIVGTIPCALLILLENPMMAIWFVVFIVVLQQFEGNIIYPRVVGSAIGISGFWVLLAVTLGGGLFGIFGILLGVPLMAVIYTVYGEYVNKKVDEKSN